MAGCGCDKRREAIKTFAKKVKDKVFTKKQAKAPAKKGK